MEAERKLSSTAAVAIGLLMLPQHSTYVLPAAKGPGRYTGLQNAVTNH
jgi:hypothetical protein